jgi:hypothetical protein
MAVYREIAGIEFGKDDDAMLDRWLDGADAARKQEVRSKGDKITLAELLDRAIEGGMKAVGSRLATEKLGEASDRPGQPALRGGVAASRGLKLL